MTAQEQAQLRDRVARARLGAAPPEAPASSLPPKKLDAEAVIGRFGTWLRQVDLVPFSERCQWCGKVTSATRVCADCADLNQYEEAA